MTNNQLQAYTKAIKSTDGRKEAFAKGIKYAQGEPPTVDHVAKAICIYYKKNTGFLNARRTNAKEIAQNILEQWEDEQGNR